MVISDKIAVSQLWMYVNNAVVMENRNKIQFYLTTKCVLIENEALNCDEAVYVKRTLTCNMRSTGYRPVIWWIRLRGVLESRFVFSGSVAAIFVQ